MKVGVLGIGKLGGVIALAAAEAGHQVMGYDVDEARMSLAPRPWKETGPAGKGDLNDWWVKSSLTFGTMQEVCDFADILLVIVPTPHGPEYEGVTPIPDTRADFDYSYLRQAAADLAGLVVRPTVVSIMSTVMPGTTRREVLPITDKNENIKVCYSPLFPAMSTAWPDFINAEFIVAGSEHAGALDKLAEFYAPITSAPVQKMQIESAELCKVMYNCFVSAKISIANVAGEFSHKVGADADEVMNGIKLATRRLLSPMYLTPGMGDGGSCHPRDLIAMSWAAEEYGLSFDFFGAVMKQREQHARWMADIVAEYSLEEGLPICLAGLAFKPGTGMLAGSPAVLTANILRAKGYEVTAWDLHVTRTAFPRTAHVFLISCRHPEYASLKFPAGSIVVDPHRYIPEQDGVTVVRLGEGRHANRANNLDSASQTA